MSYGFIRFPLFAKGDTGLFFLVLLSTLSFTKHIFGLSTLQQKGWTAETTEIDPLAPSVIARVCIYYRQQKEQRISMTQGAQDRTRPEKGGFVRGEGGRLAVGGL